MNAAVAEHKEFAPPPVGGHGRALVIAVLAHLVLVAALTVGVQWKRSLPDTVVEAELWSAIPKPAAPKLVEPPPAPPPAPPAPKPVPKVAPPPPGPSEADIALEREKQRLEKEKLEQEKRLAAQKVEQQKLEQQKREKEKQLALEKKREKETQLALEKKKRAEEEAQAAKQREIEAKRAQALKAEQAAKKAKLEAEQAAKKAKLEADRAKEEAAKIEAARQVNLQRMAGLAGATGGANATGSAAKASGPSNSYAGRVSAAVKPNIVFTDSTADNPTALVEVRAAPDGTIVGRKMLKGSGNKAWDEAVLKAIDKTGILPRDVDGTVPQLLEINFRRRD